MRTAIFKQEWRESWSNKRLIWIPIVLMLLASMQPLTLYFLPDILASGGNTGRRRHRAPDADTRRSIDFSQ